MGGTTDCADDCEELGTHGFLANDAALGALGERISERDAKEILLRFLP